MRFESRAQVKYRPLEASTAVVIVDTGTVALLLVVVALPSWPKSPRPQQRMVPCAMVAQVW